MRFVLLAIWVGCSYSPPPALGGGDDLPEPDAAIDGPPAPDAPADTPVQPSCAGYTAAGTSNYLVAAIPADWQTAQATCQATANGHLVVIADPTENALVRGMLPTTTRFWMGFSDLDVEDTWKWLDGTDVPRAAQFWDGGQPNDNQAFGGEDCGEMSNAGTWNDKNCINAQLYVCECP